MKKLLLLISAVLILGVNAFAATTPNSAITVQTPKNGLVQFLQGTDSAGTYKTLYSAGSNGSKISGIYVTTNDPSQSHLVTCQVVSGGVNYGGAAVTIAVSSGFANAVPAVNIMSTGNWPGLPLDWQNNPYIFLKSGDTLQCTFASAITSTDVVNAVAVGGDF